MTHKNIPTYIWLILTLCSFGYELPIITVSSVDKFNPRLFDILFVVGLLFFNTRLFAPCKNPILTLWGKTICWMSLCALATVLVVPKAIGLYSLYFLFKYIQGYIILRIFILNKEYLSINTLEIVFISIGVFVSLYSLSQFWGLIQMGSDFSLEHDGDLRDRFMVGPYSSTYFALAQIIPICLLFCINRIFRVSQFRLINIVFAIVFLFVGANCGSRTALFLSLASLIISIFLLSRNKILLGICTIVMAIFILNAPASSPTAGIWDSIFKENVTISRGKILEEEEDSSIEYRIGMYREFRISDYDLGAMMPILGSGFYVSPKNGRFRIGYGFHNNYLFAFEQLGIIGFILFVVLLARVLKLSYKYRNENSIGKILFVYTLVLCVANISGQIFWQGFGTCDLNTLTILLMALAVEPSL